MKRLKALVASVDRWDVLVYSGVIAVVYGLAMFSTGVATVAAGIMLVTLGIWGARWA